jgi:undecaprenyl-phosphate 4-deoxy-4-formamido-L-arabinose transferase
MKKVKKPYISVVIPVYNEEGNLETLFQRLTKVLDALKKPYEIIFTNDGSRDKSLIILEKLYKKRPKEIRVIDFKRNFGQHMAVMAGFEESQGDIVITLDADLQNPPEELPKLIALMEKGHDLVSGYRVNRQDTWFRRFASKIKGLIRDKITNIHITDEGCMLRAYSRDIVDLMVETKSAAIYIPALAYSYSSNPAEIPVSHAARATGTSKYRFYDLMRLYFDLMTGYSLLPLQAFTFMGFSISILSVLFFLFLLVRRIFVGPEMQGLFTLFAVLFFLLGVILMGLGITGEYIGRIYQEVRKKPRFVVKRVLSTARVVRKI